ncbi:hypothetical protein BH11PSE11_BH11PSE11_20450 [soil metagenome]
MVQAIGAPVASAVANSISQIGGLEARLATYQKQLSDCVNCDSAKTTEGKTAIQNLSNKILEVQARLEQLSVARTGGQQGIPEALTPAAAPVEASSKAIGNTVDVFA